MQKGGPGISASRSAAVLVLGEDRDKAALAAGAELDRPRPGREDRVVTSDSGPRAGLEARAALAHDDLAARHRLAGEDLDAEALRLGVAAVAARAQSLLVRHYFSPSFSCVSAFLA